MIERRPSTRLFGITMMLAGAWIALRGLGVPLLPVAVIWPVFVLLVGVAFVVEGRYKGKSQAGALWFGIWMIGLSVFFCSFTIQFTGITWANMRHLWPLLIALPGYALFILYYLDDTTQDSFLTPALLLGSGGLVLLMFTTGQLNLAGLRTILRWWPIALAIVALWLFIQVRSRAIEDS